MTSGKRAHAQSIGTAARENPARVERCPLVVMGASAGGLEVFKEFFSRTPSDSGMAFIVIQHFDPKYDSLMPELLAKHTLMKVLRAEDGLRIEANRVYVAASSTALQ